MIDITRTCTVDGAVRSIPSAIGDERPEELACTVCIVDGMVISPSGVYTVKCMPKQPWNDIRLNGSQHMAT